MAVILREAIRTHVPLALVKQDAACAQVNALVELAKGSRSPCGACLAHSCAVSGVDSVNLCGSVVVVTVERVWNSVWIFDGKLSEFAGIGWRRYVCPCVLVKEDDLNAHLATCGDGVFEFLRG